MNWAYIAGFFDGEGTISSLNKKRHRIGITQTNQRVLDFICDFTKLGRVGEIKKRKSHWKDSWLYYISKQEHVLKFLKKILPYLIVKHEIARETISYLEKRLAERRIIKERLAFRIKQAKKLRKKGLSYRAIGKTLNIDFGYARRLILRDE